MRPSGRTRLECDEKVKRTTQRGISILAAVGILFCLGTQSFAETLREKVDRLQQELNTIEQNITANQQDISKQEQLRQYYAQQQNTLKAQIEAMNQQITESEALLAQKQEDLGAKILEVENQKQLFEQRLVAQYVARDEDNLSYLIGTAGWGGLLRYQENLQVIAVSDTELIEALRIQQAELEQQKAETEALLAELNEQRAALAAKVVEYADAIQQADASIDAAQAEVDAQNEAYGEKYEEMQRAKDALQAWITSNDTVDFEYGGGVFAWPIPGVTDVSSNFGWRDLWGRQDFHRGVDFRAATGTPIVAAESGIVSTRADASYGICVKINHGSGLLTVYAHMSTRAQGAVDGAYVTKGDTIGYVGNTGNSSGPHLHFEVNRDRQVVNPWNYLNG